MTELEKKIQRAMNKVMTKFEGGLEIKTLDSVEAIEAEIKMLQSKLEFYKELEKTKTPAEEAYKRWMGEYPPTGPSVDGIDDIRWRAFQMGYNVVKENCKVEKSQLKQSEKLYDLISDWWDEVFCANPEPLDRDGEYMDKNPTIMDLVESIENWLPKEQSAAGSQNVYVECSVEGYNDCLNEIKGKLR